MSCGGMEGLSFKVVVGGPAVDELQRRVWRGSAPPPRIIGLKFGGTPEVLFRRPVCPSLQKIRFQCCSARSCQQHNGFPHSSKNTSVTSEGNPSGLPWELGRVQAIFRVWFSGLKNGGEALHESRRELKQSAGRACLLLITASLFIAGRFCRPALAAAEQAVPAQTVESPRDRTTEGKGRGERFETSLQERQAMEYLKGHPTNIQALKVVLYQKMKRGDIAKAIKTVERLMVLQPDELEWRLIKAQLHEFEGQFEDARRGYEELLKIRPLWIRALQGLAMVMHKCGNDDAAIEMLDRALQRAIEEKKDNEVRNLKLLRGHMYIVQEKFEEALEHYEGLIKEDPSDFRPYLCQGIVYSVLEKRDEAEKKFEKYRKLVPKDFPNRGFLDDLMITAKVEAQKRYEQMKKDAEMLTQGKNPPKPMKQPHIGGDISDLPDDDS